MEALTTLKNEKRVKQTKIYGMIVFVGLPLPPTKIKREKSMTVQNCGRMVHVTKLCPEMYWKSE
ncbi:unnamed protein product [Sphenostylis stenocarpa]|uniref:Uncharacterized protein n=1 Tax=Sphenostylis stenocarpa TaxID=92480 RepID=A0AA86V8G7_9FABA|nr:unnamed protein product [Sphenostylis stenocarpa]